LFIVRSGVMVRCGYTDFNRRDFGLSRQSLHQIRTEPARDEAEWMKQHPGQRIADWHCTDLID
jgi:hypothetical protein